MVPDFWYFYRDLRGANKIQKKAIGGGRRMTIRGMGHELRQPGSLVTGISFRLDAGQAGAAPRRLPLPR
jgi:hypothetical protein